MRGGPWVESVDGSTWNYFPGPITIQIFAASPSTQGLVETVQKRFGGFRSQKTPEDFKAKEIRAQRELERNPNYVPDYLPKPPRTSIEVKLTAEVGRLLQTLLATGNYLDTQEQALLHCFLRWYDAEWQRDHITTKLEFRAK